ncbi:alpha/beta hydrolase family protein [Brevundimonas variabilis]|uniref:Dipeptidyl aminopeptidase/acylaminoacyl peptidase n=1 Tax=Brevundimonas variabilis TaxID=74312 RepID=A0A7W9CHX3_9CAUL|nr:alpha/beta fold hydrolase [Brevundimonas variabilis]MBB5745713.1 dipeptidyl aminopeptidase/acylaminoacyl peptidase [Brevundimonas variabilis]
MPGLMSRLAVTMLAAWLLSSTAAFTQSRPLSIDDVLDMESLGAVAFSPDGRWAIHERRGPYGTAPRYDRGHRTAWAITDLWMSDLEGDAEPVRLLPNEEGVGLLFGAWSPTGKRLLVYRLTDTRLEAGIVSMADRSVRWTDLAADLAVTGSTAAWLDDDRLALTVRESGDLPWLLRFDGTGSEEMRARWALTTAGDRPSRLIVDTVGGELRTNEPTPTLRTVVIHAVTADVRTLATGAIRDFATSPDGVWVAVLTSTGPVALDPAQPVVQSPVLHRSRLALFHAKTGRTVSIDPDLDVAPHLLSWSAASRAVLIWARRDGSNWSDGGLLTVDLDGETDRPNLAGLRPLAPGLVIDEFQAVRAGWLGDRPVLYGRRASSDRFDWWLVDATGPRALTKDFVQPPTSLAAVTKTGALAFADGALWHLNAFGAATRLSPADERIAGAQTSSQMQPLRLRVNDPPRRDWVASANGASLSVRDVRGGQTAQTSVSDCPGLALVRAASESRIATACLDDGVETLSVTGQGGVKILARANPQFETIAVPRPLPVPHLDRLGRPATSWLYLPADRTASQVKGLLVLAYPGGSDDGRYVDATSLQRGPRPQMLTTGGFAVLSPSFPNETESERLTMAADFEAGLDMAVDAALAAHTELPKDRIVLVGHSFGGYVALTVAARSERYRGYIAWAAPTDLSSNWGEFLSHSRIWPGEWFTLNQKIGGVENGQAAMGGPPWSDVLGYASASPYLAADKIRAPVLLITADRDYVSMTQSERMLSALHRQGRSARYIVYWGEGHLFSSPANIRDVYGQMFDWLNGILAETRLPMATGSLPSGEPNPQTRR